MPRIPGTTSACAENTDPWANMNAALRNYLRVRGEYWILRSWPTPDTELPPRARRIRKYRSSAFRCHGTTSACAENTAGGAWIVDRTGNYLRVRGEY